MNEKMKSKEQFETIHVKEENERGEKVMRVVTKQSLMEWEEDCQIGLGNY